ncbi:fumarylacetoacetate hydrolase family protein [Chelativorans alearense]|uniref:fumarylacetoacetate hydrolase family protein n=1 Tax=Chelativorans alearense TaxID=2681495 RepID=UPI0013D090B3|nr:fumarylacetoacetate hydrolase family protein [Chelativorans alearense]
MKLATFRTTRTDKIGALGADGSHLVDLATAAEGRDQGAFASMLALIEGGERALDLARSVAERAEASGDHLLKLDSVELRAPIPVPPQIRDFSVFPTHIRQAPVGMQKLAAMLAGKPIPDISPAPDVPEVYRKRPIYYITNRFSVIGPEQVVKWPEYSQYRDFELELAAVLWKTGKEIPVERAADHIFGYTLYNDFSARDTQLFEMQGMLGPAKGKSFDLGNAMGPCIVTRDEIENVRNLQVTARINGEVFTTDDCSQMLHGFEEMIAFVSQGETLYPGEIFGSGTIGNACGLEHARFFEKGDVVEIECEPVGVLRNTFG